MNTNYTFPTTLEEAILFFADPDNCLNFMVSLRWPDRITCPRCGSHEVRFIKTRRLWECKARHSKRQFSAKIGTIFEDSPIKLAKWFAAIWLIANAKNGISSYEVHRALNVTQKTAWFMLHRIRLAMQTGTFERLSGEVEIDETFIGGAARFMHKSVKARKITGTGGAGKTVVMGLLERGKGTRKSRVQATVLPNTRRASLHREVRQRVVPGSEVYTDEYVSYRGLSDDYTHQIINHAEEYVRGHVTTNRIENFWTLLKRTIKGTYTNCEPFHLHRYLAEQTFRFNERGLKDAERFLNVVVHVIGRRLTYAQLTGNDQEPAPA